VAELRCVGATCAYGDTVAVNVLDLHVADGELVALFGPAGSGKTSALRMIAGIEPLVSGRVLIGDEDVTAVHPAQRGVAMVFAGFSVSERLTIADHIGLPLAPGADVTSAASAVGLDRLDRRVKALSPLERQLLALARAIAVEPRLLLLDEPIAGLDELDSARLRDRIMHVHRALRLTTLFATRDLVMAAAVSDRVVTLHRGTVQQVSDAASLRAAPATVHAARSLGSVLIGIPPGAIRFDEDGQPVRIIAADDAFAYAQVPGLRAPDEPLAIATAVGVGLIGTTVSIAIDQAQVFDPVTGTRLA